MKFWPVFKYSHRDLLDFKNNFVRALQSLNDKTSSLPGFVTTLPDQPFVLEDEIFEAITIGGTNYSRAMVHNTLPVRIMNSDSGKLPFLDSLEQFSDFILETANEEISKIVLNFAYPLDPVLRDGRIDGVLTKSAKEHRLTGLVGQLVGQTLEDSIRNQAGRNIRIEVANDVVCLLHQPVQLNEKSIAGGVVGTGFNFGFHRNLDQIYNLESGNFSDFHPTPTGLAIDRNSQYPGQQLWEKEVAGAYLYQHYNLIAQEQGWSEIASTTQLSSLAKTDSEQVQAAMALLQRSAALVACEMAAIYEYMNIPKVHFVIEGNLFWSGKDYLLAVRKNLSDLGVDPIENAVILKAQSPLTGTIALGIRDEEIAV